MRLINTHGHGHTGDRTFHYDPARWEARISLPGPDGTYEDLTSQLTHGRSESRYSDGFPLGQVVPDAAGASSVVIKVTLRPKVMPVPNSGVCISLWTPGLFGFPDSATASLVYR